MIDRLGTQVPVALALTTPLAVSLARTIYNPRPGERAGELRDPAELCSPELANRAAVEYVLLDGLIPAAYRQPGRWTTPKPINGLPSLPAILNTGSKVLILPGGSYPMLFHIPCSHGWYFGLCRALFQGF